MTDTAQPNALDWQIKIKECEDAAEQALGALRQSQTEPFEGNAASGGPTEELKQTVNQAILLFRGTPSARSG